jgi:DNA-binding HxlR family transcriptional regulator
MAGASKTPSKAGPRRCSIAGALEVVGDRWSLLVVRELYYNVRRFNDLVANTGAPRDILTARLRKLEEQGVLTRRQYFERPPRFEYVLTDAGRALAPVLGALRHWGDEHVTDGPPPVVFSHSCGEVLVPVVHCRACLKPLESGSIHVLEGPNGPLDGLH